VSVKLSSGGRQHEQKRLLLVNLKELYLDFGKITGIHVGFSTFCALPPKSCVTVVSSGAHSVCVCEQHQNAKLLLAALPVQIDYNDLLDVMVCILSEHCYAKATDCLQNIHSTCTSCAAGRAVHLLPDATYSLAGEDVRREGVAVS